MLRAPERKSRAQETALLVHVRDTDHGYKALVGRVFGFGKPQITVGIHADQGSQPKEVREGSESSGLMSLIKIATIHEFGLGQKERSFIRAWFDENQGKCREQMGIMMQSVISGKRTKEQILELLGARWKGEIQKRISAGLSPDILESTKKRKGSDKPLIDTGQLRSAIDYKVKL